MNFLDTYGTESGGTHDLFEPGFQMGQGRDVLKALVGERSAVITLSRSDPAKNSAEAVVVVVLGKSGQGLLGSSQTGEALAVENLSLEDVPESLDLAIGPGRADLGSQVPDAELLEALAEPRKQAGQPANERLAVVAHELQGLATEFETLIHPEHDGSCLLLGQDAKADNESGVVVDQAGDPGLDVSAAEVDEEGPFEIDVPELVGTAPLIARPGLTRHGAAAATTGFEELVDVVGADSVNLAPAHFGGDPFRIPVGVQTDRDDDHVHPSGDCDPKPMRSPGIVDQASDPVRLKGGQPAVERAASDFELLTRRLDANLLRKSNRSHPTTDLVKPWLLGLARRPTVLSGQEQEARALLVAMPTSATVRIGRVELSRVRHAGTIGPAVPYLSRKFN